MRRRAGPPAEAGQAAVELALALPLVALLLVLVAQAGMVVKDQVMVVHAAREAARAAAVDPEPGAGRRAATAAGPLDPARLAVVIRSSPAGLRGPPAVTAVVSYRSAVFVPLLAGVFPDILLTGRASMGRESAPSRAVGANR